MKKTTANGGQGPQGTAASEQGGLGLVHQMKPGAAHHLVQHREKSSQQVSLDRRQIVVARETFFPFERLDLGRRRI
ncbi:hypothetical protein AB0K60_25770 [Thermopolyspora sp. NPDC052614]|uniref:hypothetical protein n=1 Tax=Thermopolyspora sp. NPDC052614 TaxID=3155682 RepID=UPI0034164280